ncbi:isocyanide synthase family protein [Nocardia sp. CDC159]|uniref:Isocyanide synthase family protein n=1 Tax=Nocardia pulmonis TaxID=2951408 RepID=A0A9X2EE37_9NOCA|nr:MULTISPECIES: isocyanide synthase family protein [Nocardia]MCM6778686.1 isocyanide synthase family protein [Nocardia pulmonis]MCM6791575.1 isocyanide synthase family protein [Nocardia sp. CDC159]
MTTFATAEIGETREPLTEHAVAERILRIVFRRRRIADPTTPCASEPCPQCLAPHLDTVGRFIAAGKPISFVIPAFPAKSRNHRKTIGRLPDLGEQLALESVQSFCEQVSAVYSPGAVVTICSDGHVFSDALGIPDEHIDDYGAELMRIIRSIGGGAIGLYGLRDAMPNMSWDRRRVRLLDEYAETIDEIRESVRTDETARRMFNGIHRFVTEDHAVLLAELSATQRRNRAKQTAYEVVQRSQAWSRLVEQVFPGSVRLSIHPQDPHHSKIGFHLLRTDDSWLTPWHGVVLDDGVRQVLVKRARAEELGGRLVWRNSRPSHFVVEQPIDIAGATPEFALSGGQL